MTNRALALCILSTVACTSGDGLVVVSLSANPPITGVASLQVTMTVGARVSGPKTVSQLPSGTISSPTAAFAIDVSPGIGSAIDVHVDALDGGGSKIASGDGSGAITAGVRTTVDVVLQGALLPDMAAAPRDMASNSTGAVDMAIAVDLRPHISVFNQDTFNNGSVFK
jgi:hypothetical protein